MKRIERRRQKSEEKAKTRARMHVDIDPDNYESFFKEVGAVRKEVVLR